MFAKLWCYFQVIVVLDRMAPSLSSSILDVGIQWFIYYFVTFSYHPSKLAVASMSVPGHQRRPKPQLRSVRLEIPEEKVVDIQNQSKILEMKLQHQRRLSYAENSHQIPISTLTFTHMPTSEPVVLYSPSPFLQFTPGSRPDFIHEVFVPNTAYSFVSKVSPNAISGRFLVYVLTKVDSAPRRTIITVNGNTIHHVLGDGQPIDITNLLQPLNSTNWIITGGHPDVPVLVIGVWVTYISMETVLREISSIRPFIAPVTFDTCPISRSTIVYPAKGVNCQHNECFDAYAFLTRAVALGMWSCPICELEVPLENLVVDVSRSTSDLLPRATSLESNLSNLL